MKAKKSKPKVNLIYDRLPEEGKAKMDNFKKAYKIYFNNQTYAGTVLKVGQVSVWRYLNGVYIVPLEVARRFQEFTKGAVDMDSIFFDFNGYLYDQKQAVKKEKKKKVITPVVGTIDNQCK